jgi:hypothetical protein
MYRLNTMTGPNNQTLVSGVSYGPANQMLQLSAAAFGDAEQRPHSLADGCSERGNNYLFV